MKDIIIVYHADCPDGFGGAWAAWKKFRDKAEYIPGYYNNIIPEDFVGKEIYFIDFIYSDNIVDKWIKNNKRVTAIDHHLSKEKLIRQTKDYSYALNYSGAVLAWKYFHPNKPVPKMLQYIEDRDLYQFKLPHSRAVGIFIDSFSKDFKTWDRLAKDIENKKKLANAAEKGKVIVKYEAELISKLVEENARLVNFEGYDTFAINVPHEFASDVGDILRRKKPPIAVIWSEGRDLIRVSLRSDGTVDVSKIAEKYGGGGHKKAAGFRLPLIKSFPWKDK